jgi:hypothetical protein
VSDIKDAIFVIE